MYRGKIPAAGSVDFEARANLSRNFIENTVDPATGQPYFDVFHGNPVELFHDWPDFGDLTARYWEAGFMIQDIAGVAPANLERLGELLLNYMDSDGLNYRPLTPYSSNVAEMFDQARTLYALCTAYMATQSEKVQTALINLTEGLVRITQVRDGYRYLPGCHYQHGKWKKEIAFDHAEGGNYFVGPLIRPLVKVWDMLDYQPALDLAVDLSRFVLEKGHAFGPNGEFKEHIHSRFATAAGLFTCGKATGKTEWTETAKKAWNFGRALAGPCGFAPEVLGEWDPIFRSETCSIMDYMDLTLLLAVEGDESKWGEAERILRNHLIESQLTHADWTEAGPVRPGNKFSLGDRVPQRMLGGFAGWSALDDLLALVPRFDHHWLQSSAPPEMYLGKMRLFQNCCGPAGLRAIYQAWSQALRFTGNELRVNMLVNRRIPEAGVCVRDRAGGEIEVEVNLKRACDLSLRMPEWTSFARVGVFKNDMPVNPERRTGMLVLENLLPGDRVVTRFPYTLTQQEYATKHIGFAPTGFSISFQGDSAVAVHRMKDDPNRGKSAPVSELHGLYPLYRRRMEDVYTEESNPRTTAALINWY